jgi:hypothetical protein
MANLWIDILLKILGPLIAVIGLVGAYYLRLLDGGKEAAGSADHQKYLAFRHRLALGGQPVQLYAHWLKRMLYAVDRYFGDLRQPTPLWTAASYDRCLLLALLYPILSIVLIWVATGGVGPAEKALRLARGVGWEKRLLALLATTLPWWGSGC